MGMRMISLPSQKHQRRLGVVVDLTSQPYSFSAFYNGVWGTLVNARTGTLTDAQKQALVAQEQADLIKASGNTMDPAAALEQAQSDTTSVLMSRGADPSQAGGIAALGLSWSQILLYGGLGLAGILILTRK